MLREYPPEQLLEALFGTLQTFAVRVDVRHGDRDPRVFRSPSAPGLDPGATAEDAPGLVCCPLEIDEPLGRQPIELGDIDAFDPELGGDLDDAIPVGIPGDWATGGTITWTTAGFDDALRWVGLVAVLIMTGRSHRSSEVDV